MKLLLFKTLERSHRIQYALAHRRKHERQVDKTTLEYSLHFAEWSWFRFLGLFSEVSAV